jgi:hypothetical protein
MKEKREINVINSTELADQEKLQDKRNVAVRRTRTIFDVSRSNFSLFQFPTRFDNRQ